MPEERKRLARRRPELPPLSSWASAVSHPLPPDLVSQSVNRLGWVALLYAVAVVLFHFLGRWLNPEWQDTLPDLLFMDFNVLLAAVSGVGICALAWSRILPPLLMLDIGLIFEVFGALLISLSENSKPGGVLEPFPGPSSVSVWITIFILAVPTRLGKALLAAGATAAMVPLGLAVNLLIENIAAPPLGYWVLRSFPSLFIAGWAMVLARFIYKLGAQVSKERELGSYQLIEVLGKGGMGEVWRASHRMLARDAAVKLIPPAALASYTPEQTDTLVRRFQREAKATAALRSPHTITLYDYGLAEDNSFYYAMELLEGLDLWYLVERHGPLSPARTVYFLRQACDSLAEAHAAGLVHRDIKPTNLFACRLGFNYDFVKVLDFGLVKDELASHDTRQLTANGVTTGTPAYMAPEGGRSSAKVDQRSDIYSLACVGYWLLTGQLVFDEVSPMATLLAHINDEPAPPSRRTGIAVPESLERVMMQCLEKKPDQRPQTALELSRLLAASDVGEPWNREQARQWWETNLPRYCQTTRAPASNR